MAVTVVNESRTRAVIEGLQVRILVVEDNKAFLDFVTSVLLQEPNLQVVGEVQDGLEAVQRAQRLQPDIVLLDIGLPGLNGIESARLIHKHVPHSKIVFLSQESSPEVVAEAFSLGARAYVSKAHACNDLPLALKEVLEGRKFVSRGLNGFRTAASR
jgi:two-component system, NarL family, nitrate/nitrite response regulator NarL